MRAGKWSDTLLTVVSLLLYATPVFWLGLMLIVAFAVNRKWFPPTGFVPWSDGIWDWLRSITLPIITLSVPATAVIAGRRLWWLSRLIRSGQPAVGRTDERAVRAQAEVVEVVGQRKLLAWTIPGLAHAFAFWGFCVLGLTIVEAFGALVDRSFSIPVIDGWAWIPWVEDFFAVMVLVALVVSTSRSDSVVT